MLPEHGGSTTTLTQEAKASEHPGYLAALRLALAEAVAKPGSRPFHIDANNERVGHGTLDRLVAADQVVVVELDPEVVAWDADRPELGELVEQVAAYMAGYQGLRPVVVASGRPGHRHLFVRVPSRHLRDGWNQFARRHGIDVRLHVRPPLTRHRHGLTVEILTPTDPHEALRALQRPATAGQTGQPPKLGTAGQRALRDGIANGTDTSRSGVLRTVMVSAVNAGWSLEYLFGALLNPSNVGGRKVQELAAGRAGRLGARRYVEREYQRAADWVATRPAIRDSSAAREAVTEWVEALDRVTWKGVSGGTDRAVAGALAALAVKAGKVTELGASCRQLAETAGVTHETVRRSIGRLCAAGWIIQIGVGGAHGASSYRLNIPARAELRQSDRSGVCGDCLTTAHHQFRDLIGHDAFRWRGLGKLKALVLAGLCRHHPVATAELADRHGMTVGNMRRHLAALRTAGLVEQTADGWVTCENGNVEQVAVELHTAGTGERQRLAHDLQRTGFRLYQARREAEREGRPPPRTHYGAVTLTAAGHLAATAA